MKYFIILIELPHTSAAIHEASSMLIFPDGKGESSSDCNKIILGLDHPATNP